MLTKKSDKLILRMVVNVQYEVLSFCSLRELYVHTNE